jgi:hypothetical protein
MKLVVRTIAVLGLAYGAMTATAADVDYFAPTIDPLSMAPAKLNGPPVLEPFATFSAKPIATDVDPYDVGAELSDNAVPADNQVQTCALQNTVVQSAVQQIGPPVPPPDPDDPATNNYTAQASGAHSPSGSTQSSAPGSQTNPSCSQSAASCNSTSTTNGWGCNCDPGCRPWWVHVDYLALWVQANHLPPLVKTSLDGTPRSEAGVLPNATILFGNNYVDGGARNGGRVTLGYWLDDDEINGIQASWFTVGQPTGAANFFVNSTGSPILARPFTSGGVPNAQLAAYPGVVMGEPGTIGTLGVRSTSNMDFAGIAFSHVYDRDGGAQMSWIAGYRHLEFRENLSIVENTISTDPANPNFTPGTQLNLVDQFQTDNDFEGGQLGTEFNWCRNRWTFDASARLGLGNVHEHVNINGSTAVLDPSGNVSQLPGFLAQPSNDGIYNRNVFAFLPELELNLHYQLTDQIDLTIGYTALFLTRVARAADQIDTNVSNTELPTANPPSGIGNGPTEVLRDTSLWAQGISGGIELRF